LVEHHLAKVGVAGSNPVVRSITGALTSFFAPNPLRSAGIRVYVCIGAETPPYSPRLLNITTSIATNPEAQ
jgi:hypothetical protein